MKTNYYIYKIEAVDGQVETEILKRLPKTGNMKPKKIILATFITMLLTGGCDKSSETSKEPEVPLVPINLTMSMTKATAYGFESGDSVGLYVVNAPARLKSTGNQYDNALLKLENSVWTPETPLYYKDNVTETDFYAYYPYLGEIKSVVSVDFALKTDQSVMANYKSSDLLWGKTTGVIPSENKVSLKVSHLTSRVNVVLKAGAGWTSDELKSAEVSLTGLKAAALANFSDGKLNATFGSTKDIKMFNNGDCTFKAIVIPQTVSASEFVKITVGTNEYTLKTSIALVAGMEHTCTVTVNKTGGSFSVEIGGWETDNTDHGGSVN